MVDPATIAAITASLGSVSQISRELMALVGGKGNQAASEKILEFTQKIIEAHGFVAAMQTEYSALTNRLREREQELKDIKDFRRDKENYVFQSVGNMAVVYAYRLPEGSTEPPHWLCAACCNRNKKSILQWFDRKNIRTRGYLDVWKCNDCQAEVTVQAGLWPGHIDVA